MSDATTLTRMVDRKRMWKIDCGFLSIGKLGFLSQEGTAVDVVSTLHESNNRLSPWNVLDIFRQVGSPV